MNYNTELRQHEEETSLPEDEIIKNARNAVAASIKQTGQYIFQAVSAVLANGGTPDDIDLNHVDTPIEELIDPTLIPENAIGYAFRIGESSEHLIALIEENGTGVTVWRGENKKTYNETSLS